MTRSTLKTCCIFDLDGTLFDDTHRRRLLPQKYVNNRAAGINPGKYEQTQFDPYHDEFHEDSLIVPVAEIYKSLQPMYGMVIMTSRPERLKEETEHFLDRHGIIYDHLFMRTNTLESALMKQKYHKDHITQLYENVLFAIDDYTPVINMWRNLGIHSLATPVLWDYMGSPVLDTQDDFSDSSFTPKDDGALSGSNDCAPTQEEGGEDFLPEKKLGELRDLFTERNASYGTSYYKHGRLMAGMFPNGIELISEIDFARFGTISMMVTKMSRYARNFDNAGHQDSLEDLAVYANIMMELDSTLKGDKMKELVDDDGNIKLDEVDRVRRNILRGQS